MNTSTQPVGSILHWPQAIPAHPLAAGIKQIKWTRWQLLPSPKQTENPTQSKPVQLIEPSLFHLGNFSVPRVSHLINNWQLPDSSQSACLLATCSSYLLTLRGAQQVFFSSCLQTFYLVSQFDTQKPHNAALFLLPRAVNECVSLKKNT